MILEQRRSTSSISTSATVPFYSSRPSREAASSVFSRGCEALYHTHHRLPIHPSASEHEKKETDGGLSRGQPRLVKQSNDAKPRGKGNHQRSVKLPRKGGQEFGDVYKRQNAMVLYVRWKKAGALTCSPPLNLLIIHRQAKLAVWGPLLQFEDSFPVFAARLGGCRRSPEAHAPNGHLPHAPRGAPGLPTGIPGSICR